MTKKDKKRKQRKRAGKRGVLPSSVQALLGYINSGGPSPAPQGDTKRERAGVDAYDTLHQIIKSQQMMSANYMANLERMAFKTEITDQLKKQGEESKKVLEETKAEVRQYTKSSTEDKLKKTEAKILRQLSLKSGPNQSKVELLESDKRRYEGMLQFESGMSANVGLPKAQSVSVGGGSVAPSPSGRETIKMKVSQAETARGGGTVQPYLRAVLSDLGPPPLPAQDPRAGGGGAGAEISQGLEAFKSSEAVSSSGTETGRKVGRPPKKK